MRALGVVTLIAMSLAGCDAVLPGATGVVRGDDVNAITAGFQIGFATYF